MEIKDWLVLLAALCLCGINYYLLTRELEKPGREANIYYVIMTALILGITAVLQLLYTDNTVIFNLKRIGLMSLLAPVAYIDHREMRIPNSFILLGLIYRAALLPFELLTIGGRTGYTLLAELAAALSLLAAAALCRMMMRNSIGAGDMKLFVVMGLLLGTDGIWSAVFMSLLVSFVIAVVLLTRRKKSRKDSIPFGPAVACGTYLSIFLTGM